MIDSKKIYTGISPFTDLLMNVKMIPKNKNEKHTNRRLLIVIEHPQGIIIAVNRKQ